MIQLLLLLIFAHNNIASLELCTGQYCPPILVKYLRTDRTDEPAPILIGRDNNSGCYCRESPSMFYSVCFGRENCRSVPQELNITTVILKIKTTQIVQFVPGDFRRLSHLENLQIESNYLLKKILPGVFQGMENLLNLSISFNTNLNVLEKHSFDGLVNLKNLFLIKNGFTNILDVTIALSPNILPKLKEMSLNENSFVEIGESAFKTMKNSTLESLSMILCQIDYIHPMSFVPLKNLKILRIGENSFNSSTITNVINNSLAHDVPLQLLNLYAVGFRKRPPEELMLTIANSSIISLILAQNQFEVIDSKFFPLMPNLRYLDLREVWALNITNDAFKNLPNLRTLLLSGNKFATVPEGVLLENLTYLDLQENSGSLFFPAYFEIFKHRFTKMENLEYLNLSFNRMNAIYNTTFMGLTKLKILGLKNATIYHITNNSFIYLSNLIVLNLENNFFVQNNPTGIELDVFKGLNKLEVLLLGGCGISFISDNGDPFSHLKSLHHLGLERNHLQTLSPTDFISLPNLESINLSFNGITPWPVSIFGNNTKLKKVSIARNKLGYLSDVLLDEFKNLSELDLDDNPFTCDCPNFLYIQKWLQVNQNSNIAELLGRSTAYCVYPDIYSNFTINDFLQSVENRTVICDSDDANTKLIIILPAVFFIALIVAIIFFAYYYRWHLRYWIFLTRLYLSRKGRLKQKEKKISHTNYEYDAFVSYSNEDRNFVIRLVSMLENYHPFLKLCVYERDFQIGTVISESVLLSVAKSRKTLLVISDSYAKSQWCRWESQIAEHHRLFFENENGEYVDDTLVLIKLGPVSENHLTPTLKYLLKTRIYLPWDVDDKKQKVFWQKLRNALAPPKCVLENTYM